MDTLNEKYLIQLNLQFFADGAGGEKTELPTEKKLREAKKEGRFAKSVEINTAMMILFGFFTIKIFTPYMYEKMSKLFNEFYTLIKNTDEIYNKDYINQFMINVAYRSLEIVMPILAVCLIIGVVANVIQVGFNPSLKLIQPKMNRLNPLEGFKRIFSMRAAVELVKSLMKVILIGVIFYMAIKDEIDVLPSFFNMTILKSMEYSGNVIIDTSLKAGILFVFLAALDYGYQRFEYMKNMKMSKYEIKKEYEEAEGKPEIKQKIKQKMRQISMRRMMQDVPKADVIITNPTHYAIAIRYDQKKDSGPRVIAKGTDFLAQRIKEVAKENKVEIVENKPLARTLYATVEIGEEIPPELYSAVAEVLAFVYNLKNAS